ncbi:ArdC-like ssDNA-binding domain-containing protein [Nocardiopsis sp. FR4]|uniref:ArdC-like ssDNA-binding domain-containing protein n=1 Tax=Nocardiopsis sp. FR4 TaxID=2605985 RepID=UPI001F1DE950|nr:ArdC-like ssDNA-binding domain-containing protein [Nocardiopsis sp. FR4]
MSPRKSRKLTPEERRQRLTQVQERLKTAVADLTSSDGWHAMVTSRAWLRRYSVNNLMLILHQYPDARDVRAFGAWLKVGRHVRRGERGIRILAPVRYRVEEESESTETDDTGRRYQVRGFTVETVFDVSQTDGDPLPEPANAVPVELRGAAPEHLWNQVAAMVAARGYKLERGDCGDAYGYVDYRTRTVRVRDNVDPAQAVKTLTHELAHILCDHHTRTGLTRQRREVEAESVACLVSAVMGLDTLAYSVPYVAGWADDTDAAHTSAEHVMAVADQITEHLVEHARQAVA